MGKPAIIINIGSIKALEDIIGQDNEAHAQVRNAICQEFAKRHLKGVLSEKQLHTLIAQALKEVEGLVKAEVNAALKGIGVQKLTGSWRWVTKVDIGDDVRAQIKSEVRDAVSGSVRACLLEVLKTDWNDERLKEIISKFVGEKFNERVEQGVLARIRAAMDNTQEGAR